MKRLILVIILLSVSSPPLIAGPKEKNTAFTEQHKNSSGKPGEETQLTSTKSAPDLSNLKSEKIGKRPIKGRAKYKSVDLKLSSRERQEKQLASTESAPDLSNLKSGKIGKRPIKGRAKGESSSTPGTPKSSRIEMQKRQLFPSQSEPGSLNPEEETTQYNVITPEVKPALPTLKEQQKAWALFTYYLVSILEFDCQPGLADSLHIIQPDIINASTKEKEEVDGKINTLAQWLESLSRYASPGASYGRKETSWQEDTNEHESRYQGSGHEKGRASVITRKGDCAINLLDLTTDQLYFEMAILSHTMTGYLTHPFITQYAVEVAGSDTFVEEKELKDHQTATVFMTNVFSMAKHDMLSQSADQESEKGIALLKKWPAPDDDRQEAHVSVELDEFIDIFSQKRENATEFLQGLVAQASGAEIKIIQHNMEQVKNMVDEVDTGKDTEESVDGHFTLFSCVGKHRRSDRLRIKATSHKTKSLPTAKKADSSTMEEPEKLPYISQEIAEANPRFAHAMAQELAQIVAIMRRNNTLNLEKNICPSAMDVDIDGEIKQRRDNWQTIKDESEKSLEEYLQKQNKTRKQHETWYQERHIEFIKARRTLGNCYHHMIESGSLVAESPVFNASAMKLIASLELIFNRVTAKKKAEKIWKVKEIPQI